MKANKLFLAAGLIFGLQTQTEAHEWIGQVYPQCCTVSGGDCRQIPGTDYVYDGTGFYLVRWRGQHHTIAEKDAKPSRDGRTCHGCVFLEVVRKRGKFCGKYTQIRGARGGRISADARACKYFEVKTA